MLSRFRSSVLTLIAITIIASFPSAADASQLTDYNDAVIRGDYTEALELARKIVKSGGGGVGGLLLRVTRDEDHLVNVRIIGLQALGYYCENIGLEPGMTEEAKEYYTEALAYAGDNDRRMADIDYEMAQFYFKSGRPGLAIPLLSNALSTYEAKRDTYNTFLTLVAWSSLYTNMGETALGDYFEKKWLATAEKFFVLRRRPRDEDKWFTYHDALTQYAYRRSQLSDVAELNRTWERLTEISETYSNIDEAANYLSGAKFFAIAGEPQTAIELLDKAEKQSVGSIARIHATVGAQEAALLKNVWERDIVCARAQVMHEIGQTDQALIEGRSCETMWGFGEGATDTGSFITLGEIYESAGDQANAIRFYNWSIDSLEGMRSSFNVMDRAAFFTNPIIQVPYWGLIRIHAKGALANDTVENFHRVVQAKERIRARQFGELSGSAMISTEAIAGIQQRLSSNSVVLDFVLTDREIVLTAFSGTNRTVALIPYERESFRDEILKIVRSLANPSSEPDALGENLHRLSQVILGPVTSVITDKTELIVLTDGELNLIPFELWSIGADQYEPLLDSRTVRYASSLRSLAEEQETGPTPQSTFFAVADPIYPDAAAIAGLSAVEIEEATRSTGFQSYFLPLPETRSEVESIAALFPGESNTLLLGTAAIESRVKEADLSGFGYVHFATHGILGGEVPGIGEPALVLGGESDGDGFLTASEAENLSLNAQLTVLSACNTGSGTYVHGEGVMGMSRAFLLAGSESVLVSLWPVASEATEDLMVLFYRYMQTGERPETALRQAKLEIMRDLPHPFFWAPFILIIQN